MNGGDKNDDAVVIYKFGNEPVCNFGVFQESRKETKKPRKVLIMALSKEACHYLTFHDFSSQWIKFTVCDSAKDLKCIIDETHTEYIFPASLYAEGKHSCSLLEDLNMKNHLKVWDFRYALQELSQCIKANRNPNLPLLGSLKVEQDMEWY